MMIHWGVIVAIAKALMIEEEREVKNGDKIISERMVL